VKSVSGKELARAAEVVEDQTMRRSSGPGKAKHRDMQVPVFIEKDEDGLYVGGVSPFRGLL
jgi:hypothetical protein